MRQATVRYYFDAHVLGLGKTVAGLSPDATYRGCDLRPRRASSAAVAEASDAIASILGPQPLDAAGA